MKFSFAYMHALLLSAIALLGVGNAGAQADLSAAPAPIPLTRDGALVSAMTYNRAVEVARYGPQIAATLPPEARAAFDPVLLATLSYGKATRPDLFNYSTTTTTASGGLGNSTGTGNPVTNAAGLVSAIARLNRTLSLGNPNDVTTTSQGAQLSLQERLPTGTQVFLTGMTNLNDVLPGNDQNAGDVTLGVTQPLLRGAGLKANLVALRQAKNRVAQSEETFRRALLGTARDVELAYWQLVLANEVLKIREFAVTLANEQVKRAEAFQQAGKAIRGDVMAAQADEATRRADLATARGELRNRNIDLVRLMNPDGAPKWDALFAPQDPAEAVAVAVNLDESSKAAIEHRPELKEAGFDVANLGLDVVRARNNRLPQLDLVGSAGRYSAGPSAGDATSALGSDRFDHWDLGVQFQMPLPRRAEKARLNRAKLSQAQGESMLRDLEDGITAEARQAVVAVQQLWERLAATREAVASRNEELNIAQGRYEVGKVTNLDVLQVQRDVIQAQVDDATARVAYLQALTNLYAAEGTLLDRRGIVVEQVAKAGEEKKEE